MEPGDDCAVQLLIERKDDMGVSSELGLCASECECIVGSVMSRSWELGARCWMLDEIVN